MENGLIDFLHGILADEKTKNCLKKYAFFAISNCLACDNAIITPILNHEIFEIPIWTTLSSDYEVQYLKNFYNFLKKLIFRLIEK